MLLRTSGYKKATASALLFILLFNTVFPSVSYALTSGPTQPEATSFEPVDTTDMVNLQTGDFTYNIPLLEVPGPEGGYPLSLSYHAGIQPNEDASWVGLGWTLNPGAINRNVNGYPDDWYNPTNSDHVYWAGGKRVTYSVGVSIGAAMGPNVSFGLSFSQDTYLGFGIGGNIGLNFGIGGNKSPYKAGISAGVSPYGGGYVGGGVGIGGKVGNISSSLGINISSNFQSLSAGLSGGVGYSMPNSSGQSTHYSLLGASLSTNGKASLEAGGLSSSVSSSAEAKIQTQSTGFSLSIPFAFGSVNLGYNEIKYKIDEVTTTTLHGSLSSSGWSENADHSVLDDVAYDTYSLLENPQTKNIAEYADPSKVQGGSFLDFDVYSVNAQGLGGNMRPYMFQGEVLGQNRKDNNNNNLLKYYSPKATDSKPQYRFIGDFSNSYRQNYTAYSNPNLNLRGVTPPFDASPVYGNNDNTYGYAGGNKLAGSRYVNVGVTVNPSNIKGYVKTDRYQPNMVEGFSITNESGVTYHFGLPAYTYAEEVYQEKISRANGFSFNRQTKGTPYAYTWYLTTITGPDFVDRDGDGKAGSADWGYWINFEYGKWSNKYVWRNPSEGFNTDNDNQFQNCSMGYKEVYYLNAIRTRTHIALFEKDLRRDGKGASPEVFNKNSVTTNSGIYPFQQITTPTDYMNPGGMFNVNSSQSLCLNKIYLLNVADAGAVNTNSGAANSYQPSGRTVTCSDCEIASNVLDKLDVETVGRSSLESKSVRIIDFNYDYSLCANTVNSFDIAYSNTKLGKLTLLSTVTRGKGGAGILPPTQFEYELGTNTKITQAGVSLKTTSFTTTNGNFQIGDMITKVGPPDVYYGVIIRKTLTAGVYKYDFGNDATETPLTATVYTTKNPSYNKDNYDVWGAYKGDLFSAGYGDIGRLTSVASARSADAWSLHKIYTGLGSEISVSYEGDTYSKNVTGNNQSATFNSNYVDLPTPNDVSRTATVRIDVPPVGINDLNEYFAVGQAVDLVTLVYWSSAGGVNNYIDVVDSRDGSFIFTVTAVDNTQKTISLSYNQSLMTGKPTGSVFKAVLTGNIFFNVKNKIISGGGIRVNNISLLNSDNSSNSILYDYRLPSDLSYSSGVTAYEPNTFETAMGIIDYGNISQSIRDAKSIEYKGKLYSKKQDVLTYARELPPPGVMYEYVKVTSQIKNPGEQVARQIEGSTQYQFEVFRSNMVGRVNDVTPAQTGSDAQGTYYTRNVAIKKFNASIGNVRKIIRYDNNGRVISETINHFLHDGLENLSFDDFMTQYKNRLAQYFYQGYLQERYTEVKEVYNQTKSADNGVKATMSGREEYPCIAAGQTIANYLNGTKTESENISFDFYSGAITKTVETDAYGNRFMTEVIPAYRKYSSMGLKMTNVNNANMLTQNTGSYTWKVDANNTKIGLTSASVNSWANSINVLDKDGGAHIQDGRTETVNSVTVLNGNVWRPQYTYNWMPVNETADGLTSYANFADFNWTTPASSNANWKKTSEITKYDVYSKALEGTDINGLYAATRMGYNNTKVVLSGGPAKYEEIAYSGAEDEGLNQTNNLFVKKADGSFVTGIAHTGAQSLLISASGKKGFVYTVSTDKLVPGKWYSASVWVKPVTGTTFDAKLYYEVNGVQKAVSATSTRKAGEWTLLTLNIVGTDIPAGGTLVVGCRNDHASVGIYADDFRFQPRQETSTSAYVYNNFSGELTHILDNSNLYTRFEYDAAGRLVKVYKEKLGIGEFKTNEYQYNFGLIGPQPVPSVAVALKTYFTTSPYPSVKLEFLQDGVVKQTNYFQASASSITNITVPTGSYQLRFSLPATGFSNYAISYLFSPPGTISWDVPAGTLVYTTGLVTLDVGTSYEILASDGI